MSSYVPGIVCLHEHILQYFSYIFNDFIETFSTEMIFFLLGHTFRLVVFIDVHIWSFVCNSWAHVVVSA